MWIADGWKDYELLSCGGGEKLVLSRKIRSVALIVAIVVTSRVRKNQLVHLV